jgi:intracellular sulfur oxidation DsrE/DsrF family protein
MKKYLLILFVFALFAFAKTATAQTDPAAFIGAEPKLAHYDALYAINSSDDAKIKSVFRHIANSMDDERLKGKLHVELVFYGDGVAAYMKSGKYEQDLKGLQEKGVTLAVCNNTVKQRKNDRNDLFPFISYVPSANGEIILRHYDGWAVLFQ